MKGWGKPIVVDLGQSMVRCGYSGENQPRSLFPTVYGIPKYNEPWLQKPYYVGEEAVRKRGVLKLNLPIDHGEIKCIQGITQILSHCYENELKISSNSYPILLANRKISIILAPRTSKKQKQEVTEIIFEKFSAPAYYLVSPALLSIYASYKRAGIFLICGQTVTQTYINFEGFPLPQGFQLHNLGGKDLTSYMRELLSQTPLNLGTSSFDLEIAKNYKQYQGYVALDYEKQLAKKPQQIKTYELKDGAMIKIGPQAFKCPQALFRPNIIGKQMPGLPQIVYQSIMKCDMDVRRSLFENIVISGASTMFPGFCQRMRKEVALLSPANINIPDFDGKENFTWRGGSILASLPDFEKCWIWKQHYEQYGSSIVHRCQ